MKGEPKFEKAKPVVAPDVEQDFDIGFASGVEDEDADEADPVWTRAKRHEMREALGRYDVLIAQLQKFGDMILNPRTVCVGLFPQKSEMEIAKMSDDFLATCNFLYKGTRPSAAKMRPELFLEILEGMIKAIRQLIATYKQE